MFSEVQKGIAVSRKCFQTWSKYRTQKSKERKRKLLF